MLDEQLKTRIEFLKNIRIFKKASQEELIDLAKSLKDIVVHKDESIICKGDTARNMFIVSKGQVKIHDGDHIYREVGKGHVFGEYSLFHTHVRTATVTTLETTFLLRLSQEDFNKLLVSNPDIQLSVIQSLVDTIAIQNELEKELAEKTDQIEIQKKELEKAIKTKDRFFSLLAHDLRSPLSTLGSYLNLLITSDLLTKDEIVSYAKDIQKSVDGVVEMLDNLLNWAISETGEWQMDPKNFYISNAFNRIVSLYQDSANKKGISIINESKPIEVFADQNSIDVILRNLVSNALKYTDKGGQIILSAEIEGEFVRIKVQDNGRGMEESTIANLFNIDIKNKTAYQSKGTGLGLILSREFAEKNGGELTFESKLDEGSCFSIILPKAK